jgi:hypothetical protein
MHCHGLAGGGSSRDTLFRQVCYHLPQMQPTLTCVRTVRRPSQPGCKAPCSGLPGNWHGPGLCLIQWWAVAGSGWVGGQLVLQATSAWLQSCMQKYMP